jgi:hypothetical protein
MSSKNRSWVRLGLRLLVCVAIIPVCYVAGYFVLMRRDMPAVGKDGRFAYRSSFLLAPSARVAGPLTVDAPAASPMNVFFKPMDDFWRRESGFIDGILDNEPFADGRLDPGRIKRIMVFINPPGLSWVEKYEEFGRCRRVDVDLDSAAQELCQALSAAHSDLGNDGRGTTAAGTIEAVIDDGKRVFLYFCVHENSDVYVFHPESPSRDPRVNGHGQNDLLPWLKKYVLQEQGGNAILPSAIP